MLKIFFILFNILYFQNVIAQRSFYDFIDSTIEKKYFSESDWAIGLTTDNTGYPIFDSLGNNLTDNPEEGFTVIISSIKNVLYLQKFSRPCYDFLTDSCFHSGQRIILPKKINLGYTVDSISKADKEWIYPYIFKNDSVGVYIYQQPGTHTNDYRIHFITQKINTNIWFNENYILEKHWFLGESEKNLNFSYNTSTFIYRAFIKLKTLFKEHKEILRFD